MHITKILKHQPYHAYSGSHLELLCFIMLKSCYIHICCFHSNIRFVAFYINHTENSNICITPFQEEIVNWSGIEHLKDDVMKNNLAKNLLDSG